MMDNYWVGRTVANWADELELQLADLRVGG